MYLRNFLFVLFFFCFSSVFANVKIGTWNLENFGLHKTDWAINIMAKSIKGFDIVAIQEVNASLSGSQGVAKLVAALNLTGNKWDYVISDITSSDNKDERERYAFIWKTGRIKLKGRASLVADFSDEICREPFMGTFKCANELFTLVTIHAVPKKKHPETELKYLKNLPDLYPSSHFIFLGDFNCPESNSVFNPLKSLGFESALKGQKTSLRNNCKNGDCLASIYDNIFYNKSYFVKVTSGIIPFYTDIEWNKVKFVSDHVPVYLELQ